MARYKFIDRWTIQAPIDQVFRYISDARTYPQWWPVYPEVEILTGDAEPAVGSRARLVVASALGYRLDLEVEMTEYDPPHYFKTVSRGNLEGTGEWELRVPLSSHALL